MGLLPGHWPPLDKPPPITEDHNKLVDLSKVAKAQPDTLTNVMAGKCPNNDLYCDWTCTNCIRNETDIDKCPNSGDWGLTLDDGPSEYTPAVLDYLDANNIKVTFFVVGSRVVENYETLQRAHKSGHQIGVHTWSHPYLTTQSNNQIIAELQWTSDAINAAIGVRPKYMRPPYGDYDDRIRDIAKQLGYKIVIWDKDTNDWLSDGDKSFNLNWVEGNFTEWVKDPSKTGHISLEHDLYKDAAAQVPSVIPIVKGAGYTIKPVADCFGDNYYQTNSTLPQQTPTTVSVSYTSLTSSLSSQSTSRPSQSTSKPSQQNPTNNSSVLRPKYFDYSLWSFIIGTILFSCAFLLIN
ncbi:5892_t:CDS:2 [Scutellospora calospora]|uniref:5892_t:CDS:1 n=1 Tax=Scutellospora calospora TaxID=85575 RepID=A0ACA9L1Q6_9GLOM|nr:5892_t:CDS:2 [Scutellospora calospora]